MLLFNVSEQCVWQSLFKQVLGFFPLVLWGWISSSRIPCQIWNLCSLNFWVISQVCSGWLWIYQFIEAWECWIGSLLQRCGTANPFGQILNLTELTAVFVGLWNKIAVVCRSGCALCYSTSFSLLLWFSCISKVSKCRSKLKMLSVNPSAQNSHNSRNQSAIKKHTFVANFLLYIKSKLQVCVLP